MRLSRIYLGIPLVLLSVSCGGSGGTFELTVNPDVVELAIEPGSRAYVNVELVSGNFNGLIQVGFVDSSLAQLPSGIRVLSVCPNSGPVDGCDQFVDSIINTSASETAATLALEVTGIELVAGNEYELQVAGARAEIGGTRAEASFTLKLVEPAGE